MKKKHKEWQQISEQANQKRERESERERKTMP
jgi:hypothetical protein